MDLIHSLYALTLSTSDAGAKIIKDAIKKQYGNRLELNTQYTILGFYGALKTFLCCMELFSSDLSNEEKNRLGDSYLKMVADKFKIDTYELDRQLEIFGKHVDAKGNVDIKGLSKTFNQYVEAVGLILEPNFVSIVKNDIHNSLVTGNMPEPDERNMLKFIIIGTVVCIALIIFCIIKK